MVLNKINESKRNLSSKDFFNFCTMILHGSSDKFINLLTKAVLNSENKKEISYVKLCELITFIKYKPLKTRFRL